MNASQITNEITIYWHIEDVRSIRPDLANHQARKVLKHLKDNHDASVGIYWEMIEIVADILYPFTPIDYIQQQLSE